MTMLHAVQLNTEMSVTESIELVVNVLGMNYLKLSEQWALLRKW